MDIYLSLSIYICLYIHPRSAPGRLPTTAPSVRGITLNSNSSFSCQLLTSV